METTRPLGRGGIEVSALGFGCWAIGGEGQAVDGQPLGWGRVDDEESVRAVRRAPDLGVTFFDTADAYGAGHSERVLGRALGKRRADAVVATKWGNCALAWLWARSPRAVPIPGFRSVAQAQENAGALQKGALTDAQLTEVDRLLGR
ncbi:aldo/keto reductase [Streptomyces massasporeus]|uniref:aldo/keto reductase n=1 Tax=Streptomyces massasporeus TaxID=67324 RepID=UPI00379121A0